MSPRESVSSHGRRHAPGHGDEHVAPRWIGICVDDVGLDASVNAAAVELAQAGVATALSCMVGEHAWRDAARRLRRLARGSADVGLHLDISAAGGPPPWRDALPALLCRAYLLGLDARRVRAQVRAQFAAFEQAMGRPPDHVDGHRHVHQLPVVRDVLMEEIGTRYADRRVWLRSTRPGSPGLKGRIIHALGGRALDDMALRRAVPTNERLLGVYGFDADLTAYWHRLSGWIRECRDGDLLMCHAATSAAAGDAIAAARVVEYKALRSRDFARLLVECAVTPAAPSTRLGR